MHRFTCSISHTDKTPLEVELQELQRAHDQITHQITLVLAKMKTEGPMVPAENFLGTVSANVENEKMSAENFRQFIRNTLPIVLFDRS